MARKPRKGASKAFLKTLNAIPLSKPFAVGDLVTHITHGNGKIIDFTGDPSSAVVEFDHDLDGWDRILEVSIVCLRRR